MADSETDSVSVGRKGTLKSLLAFMFLVGGTIAIFKFLGIVFSAHKLTLPGSVFWLMS